MALEKRKAIGIAHELAYLLAHTPSAFVRHAQLALEFLSRNSMPCGHKQIDGIEPNLETGPAVLKDRPGARINMISTPRTGVSLPLRQLVKRCLLAAFPALVPKAIAVIMI